MKTYYISIVIPIYNEIENLAPLIEKLWDWAKTHQGQYEIIFINDCSTDGCREKLNDLACKDAHIKVIHFRRNSGQTTALQAGFDHARGDIIVPMDGDLQNDPADIPKLLDKIEEGFDVVSGWRKNRRDNRIKRNLPSKAANWLISKISGVYLHDYGCTLKAYKRDIITDIKLYGEMHRFIPIYASWQGAKVSEIEVTHHPRIQGQSKYGLERTVKVILDLIVVKFLDKYSQKPMYVFGGFGIFSIVLSILCFGLMLYYKYFEAISFIQTPLPLLAVLFFLMGFISILMGFIAEIVMRTYFESQDKATYVVDHSCDLKET
ncbi:glycosyltransferase family 2 protein [Thermodesulfobacteriota bacterium]